MPREAVVSGPFGLPIPGAIVIEAIVIRGWRYGRDVRTETCECAAGSGGVVANSRVRCGHAPFAGEAFSQDHVQDFEDRRGAVGIVRVLVPYERRARVLLRIAPNGDRGAVVDVIGNAIRSRIDDGPTVGIGRIGNGPCFVWTQD